MKKNIFTGILFCLVGFYLAGCASNSNETAAAPEPQATTEAREIASSEAVQTVEPEQEEEVADHDHEHTAPDVPDEVALSEDAEAKGGRYLKSGNPAFVARFNKAWAKCGKGCSLVQPWVYGDAAHCRRGSCHNNGHAVDIHTLNCKGKIMKGKRDLKFYSSIARCLTPGNAGVKTIWENNRKHYGSHMHIQTPGCAKVKGCGGRGKAKGKAKGKKKKR